MSRRECGKGVDLEAALNAFRIVMTERPRHAI
jgi:hypothetical protein